MTTTIESPRHLIVLGHPAPGSFNHQVAKTYQQVVHEQWQEAEIRDLYALGFDPLLRPSASPSPAVEAEFARVQACDVLVFIYPIWFGMPPAIIKGYVDRILGAHFRPEHLKAPAAASFEGKRFLSLSSSATSLPWLDERGQWTSLRQGFDTYITNLFGFREATHIHFDSVTEGARETYIAELLGRVEQTARAMCSELAQGHHARAPAVMRAQMRS